MITCHVPTRADCTVAKVGLAADTRVTPVQTLRALGHRVLVDPWQRLADLTIKEDVLVREDFEVTTCVVVFEIHLDHGIRSFVACGRDNPNRAMGNLEFHKETLVQDLIGKLLLSDFLIVSIIASNRHPFDAGNCGTLNESRF